jgi:beta-phosphoglucomutase-like phosphatase (HAD superfamily)
LQTHRLGSRFQHIVARGDYEQHKPHPEPYLTAARKVGVPPELCLAIEDSYHGVRSASAAGMMTLMVPDLLPPTEEISALCHRVVLDLHEVRRLIASALQSV